jgi:hypothetical protein
VVEYFSQESSRTCLQVDLDLKNFFNKTT